MIVVVSNRLPVVLDPEEGGGWRATPGSGGLISALEPILKERGGVWVGWPGTVSTDEPGIRATLDVATRDAGYALEPVLLTAGERRDFYEGCANEVMWPLFHDLAWQVYVEPVFWKAYVAVNRKFAQAVIRHAEAGHSIWVHDYQLMLVGQALREAGVSSRLAFFLHIPFPPLDVYLKLPWRAEILAALLRYDLVGFQTLRDRRNFIECARALVRDFQVSGQGHVLSGRYGGREVRLGTFPIGIDFAEFATAAAGPEVEASARFVRDAMPDQRVILGLDRLDYTKGIPRRLRAFRYFLERHPELHRKVTLLQVVVPSRVDVRKYRELKRDIEHLVSTINGQYTRTGWVPIHYMFRSLDRTELLGLYRAADVALVTPLKDGMNLVSKEYCACSTGRDSVLILSEFAGAAAQLHDGALLVNPYDMEGVANALHRAVTMPPGEQRRRMRRLRRSVRERDVYWWVDSFLRAASVKHLSALPVGDPEWQCGRDTTLQVGDPGAFGAGSSPDPDG